MFSASFSLESGYRSDFCSHCGSSVPHAMSNGRQVWVPAGLLEPGGDSAVAAHLFVDSRAHWDVIGDDGRQFSEMPDIDALDRLLQRADG